jgi:hypothetical protein
MLRRRGRSGFHVVGLSLGLVACGSADVELGTTAYAAETRATGWDEDSEADEGSDDAACIVDGALRRPLWIAATDDARTLVYEPGAAPIELDTPELDNRSAGFDASADFIAAAYIGDNHGIVRVFARGTGELVWERRYLDSGVWQPFVADDGRVLLGYVDPRKAALGFDGGLWLSETQSIELPATLPLGPPDADGWAPSLFLDPDDMSSDQRLTGWGWVSPASGARLVHTQALFEQALFAPPDLHITGAAFEYTDRAEAGARLLYARPDASYWIPLPDDPQSYWQQARSGNYRLYLTGFESEDPLVRVATHTGEVLQLLPPPLPPGFQLFSCPRYNRGIDVHGRVLAGVRDSHAAWLAAWEPGTSDWTLLGRPMVDVQGVDIVASHGQFVTVYSPREPGACDLTALPFVDPPVDALVSGHFQLIGVDSGLGVATGPYPEIDPARVCATWRGENERVVFDLDDGDQLSLPRSVHAGWFD